MARVWIEDRQEHKEYAEALAKWKASGKRRQPPGRWRVRWYKPSGGTGSKTCGTKPQAEEFRDRMAAQLGGGTYRDPKKADVAFSVVAEDMIAAKRKPGDRTREDYRSILDKYVVPYWGDWKVGAIQWEDVEDFLKWLEEQPGKRAGETMAGGTVVKVFRVAGMVAKRAIQTGKIAGNPFTDHELPRVGDGGEKVFLSHAEVERLSRAAAAQDPAYGLLVSLMAYCGPRWGEASATRAKRIDVCTVGGEIRREIRIVEAWSILKGGKRVLKDTKNHERRTLPVPGFIFAPLQEIAKEKGEEDFLFTGADGKSAITYGEFRGIWRKAVRDAGLSEKGITPKSLRDTAASLAVHEGANVKDVQLMLGHKSAAMTLDEYAQLWPEGLHGVAGRMDAARSRALGLAA